MKNPQCKAKTPSGRRCKMRVMLGQETCYQHSMLKQRMQRVEKVREKMSKAVRRMVDPDGADEAEMFERFAEVMHLAEILRDEMAVTGALTDRSLALALYRRGVRPPKDQP